MRNSLFYAILILLFWAGFVSAISFMEAWLKFRAPGVNLSVGLSIGSLIFTALNRVEWVLLLLFLICTLRLFSKKHPVFLFVSGSILLILLLQTFYWLPVLVERANQIMTGIEVGKSAVHFFYIAAEFIKVNFLLLLAFYFKKQLFERPGTR
ncbi:MAG: hypothetical protein CVU09_06120 [Bacteroidetes bacterium HGW-Bacteroidetes-4]|nr:MAG: hypothetical protein CVU09_06120 [Bacteroidetes bacterium HGW-Bacteroidetes-4]